MCDRSGSDDDDRAFLREIRAMVKEVSAGVSAACSESIFKESLAVEARLRSFTAEHEVPFPVTYKGRSVGYVMADLVIADQRNKVVIEVKTVAHLEEVHRHQLRNYVDLAGLRFGLLVNFRMNGCDVEIIHA